MTKVGRNALCPCGSGRKYKKCCEDLRTHQRQFVEAPAATGASREHTAGEDIRVKQQGSGRPIISGNIGEYTVVAIGNALHYSKNWKTFTDFLSHYIKMTLGSEWGNAELARPLSERHPILQWYDAYCRYQAMNQNKKGAIFSMQMIGVVYCYLGLAYNLYLMKHNVELQSRLLARLKDMKQFQGAYYELLVANCLIRAGFILELEDEADKTAKHCEFSARSKTTGTRYWVEAKMRSVPGVLGKTDKDGSTSNDPTSRLTQHLRAALQKPAPDKRMIFIDLNVNAGELGWLNKTVRRLDDRERDLAEGQAAYVFVTNMAFHRALDAAAPGEGYVHGLGISDFGKPSKIRLADWYRQKQKHIDAYNVVEAFKTYPQIPDTFDGRPASEVFSDAENYRIQIGETYFFDGVGDGGEIGTVTSVAVQEIERQVLVAITTQDGKADILKRTMSDVELEDYKKYGDAYFGGKSHKQGALKDEFEFYEWLVACYSETPKERLLEFVKDHPDMERLRSLDQFNLVLEICEGWTTSVFQRRGRH